MQHAPSDAKNRYDALFFLRFYERCEFSTCIRFRFLIAVFLVFSLVCFIEAYTRLGLYSKVVCFLSSLGFFLVSSHDSRARRTHTRSCISKRVSLCKLPSNTLLNKFYVFLCNACSISKDFDMNSVSLKKIRE